MIGLDTNILVRYLAQDDPVQSAKATEIIERRLTEENPGSLLLSRWSKPSECSIAPTA
jgi:predicted nucleic-acid-binding protein